MQSYFRVDQYPHIVNFRGLRQSIKVSAVTLTPCLQYLFPPPVAEDILPPHVSDQHSIWKKRAVRGHFPCTAFLYIYNSRFELGSQWVWVDFVVLFRELSGNLDIIFPRSLYIFYSIVNIGTGATAYRRRDTGGIM